MFIVNHSSSVTGKGEGNLTHVLDILKASEQLFVCIILYLR